MKQYIKPSTEMFSLEASAVMVNSIELPVNPSGESIEKGEELAGGKRGSAWADYEN